MLIRPYLRLIKASIFQCLKTEKLNSVCMFSADMRTGCLWTGCKRTTDKLKNKLKNWQTKKLNRVCMFGADVRTGCLWTGCKRTTETDTELKRADTRTNMQTLFSFLFTTGPQATCRHIATEHANPISLKFSSHRQSRVCNQHDCLRAIPELGWLTV